MNKFTVKYETYDNDVIVVEVYALHPYDVAWRLNKCKKVYWIKPAQLREELKNVK